MKKLIAIISLLFASFAANAASQGSILVKTVAEQ